MARLREILNKLPLRHIWMFITDKCNLNCDYCFFGYKKNNSTINFGQLKSLIDNLEVRRKYDFVISGGEPLLEWGLTEKLVKYLRARFCNSELTLQTNGLFLNNKMLDSLKKARVTIEPGIDGDILANSRHRKGLSCDDFIKVTRMLREVLKMGFDINPTMTVHPSEVNDMLRNFKKLIALGLHSIDVHPAFLADWDRKSAQRFKENYKVLLVLERRLKRRLICKSYSLPAEFSLDLIIEPSGYVLPNWTMLSFPTGFRREFAVMRLLNGGAVVFNARLGRYLEMMRKLLPGPELTYRRLSNLNAQLMLNFKNDKRLTDKFLHYKDICEHVEGLDRGGLKEGFNYASKI